MAEEVKIDSQEFIDANANALRQCFTELGINTEPTPKTVSDACIAFGDKFTESLKGWINSQQNFDGKTIETLKDTFAPDTTPQPKQVAGINRVLFIGILIAIVLLIVYLYLRHSKHATD